MSAPRKNGQEFRDRAVRMYRDRLAEPGESKPWARGHVGSLLNLHRSPCATGWRSATRSTAPGSVRVGARKPQSSEP
jgi:hypothetical protein